MEVANRDDEFRAVVVGVGGGWLMPSLLAFYLSFHYPKAHLVVVDGGIYSFRKRDHENFLKPGSKARVVVDEVSQRHPRLRIEAIPKYVGVESLGRAIAVAELINEGDIVFLQVDNDATKRCVDAYAQEMEDITLISGGTDGQSQLQILVHLRRKSVDLTPPISETSSGIANPQDASPADLEDDHDCLQEVEQRVTQPFVMLTASILMLNAFYQVIELETQDRLHEFPYSEAWFDIVTGKSRFERLTTRHGKGTI